MQQSRGGGGGGGGKRVGFQPGGGLHRSFSCGLSMASNEEIHLCVMWALPASLKLLTRPAPTFQSLPPHPPPQRVARLFSWKDGVSSRSQGSRLLFSPERRSACGTPSVLWMDTDQNFSRNNWWLKDFTAALSAAAAASSNGSAEVIWSARNFAAPPSDRK